MKQTSPLIIGICVALACISLGSAGYIFFAGSNGSNTPAKVAVVDLDAVAQRLGRIDVMNQTLHKQGANYDEQLKSIQANFQSQVTAKENEIKELGQNATDEQKQQFLGMVKVANNKLTQAKRQALAAVQQQKAVLIQQFRQEAIAVAEKVAKEKGYDIVVAKNPTVVLSFDPSLDITEAVIEAMPATTPAPEAASEEVAASQGQPASDQVAQANGNTYR